MRANFSSVVAAWSSADVKCLTYGLERPAAEGVLFYMGFAINWEECVSSNVIFRAARRETRNWGRRAPATMAAFLWALTLVHPAAAQTTFGSITGVVTDPSGAAVPSARVVA